MMQKEPRSFYSLLARRRKSKKEKEKENVVQDTDMLEFWLFVWKEEGGREGREG